MTAADRFCWQEGIAAFLRNHKLSCVCEDPCDNLSDSHLDCKFYVDLGLKVSGFILIPSILRSWCSLEISIDKNQYITKQHDNAI